MLESSATVAEQMHEGIFASMTQTAAITADKGDIT
jgi:hypothetical protein